MAQGSKFSTGKWAKSISDRDGQKYDYSEMVIEPDTKLFVHQSEVDDPDPYRRLRSRQDSLALRNPRPETDISEAAGVVNGVCLSQSAAGALALILNGSFVSGGIATMDPNGHPREAVITSAGNDSLRYFYVTGTVLPGSYFTETVQGANKGAAQTYNAFYTITQVKTSGATASTVQVGTPTDGTEFDDPPVGD